MQKAKSGTKKFIFLSIMVFVIALSFIGCNSSSKLLQESSSMPSTVLEPTKRPTFSPNPTSTPTPLSTVTPSPEPTGIKAILTEGQCLDWFNAKRAEVQGNKVYDKLEIAKRQIKESEKTDTIWGKLYGHDTFASYTEDFVIEIGYYDVGGWIIDNGEISNSVMEVTSYPEIDESNESDVIFLSRYQGTIENSFPVKLESLNLAYNRIETAGNTYTLFFTVDGFGGGDAINCKASGEASVLFQYDQTGIWIPQNINLSRCNIECTFPSVWEEEQIYGNGETKWNSYTADKPRILDRDNSSDDFVGCVCIFLYRDKYPQNTLFFNFSSSSAGVDSNSQFAEAIMNFNSGSYECDFGSAFYDDHRTATGSSPVTITLEHETVISLASE